MRGGERHPSLRRGAGGGLWLWHRYRFDGATREMTLASYHPGRSVAAVRAATGWDLRVAPDVGETPRPSPAELQIVRECDPAGFWTR